MKTSGPLIAKAFSWSALTLVRCSGAHPRNMAELSPSLVDAEPYTQVVNIFYSQYLANVYIYITTYLSLRHSSELSSSSRSLA